MLYTSFFEPKIAVSSMGYESVYNYHRVFRESIGRLPSCFPLLWKCKNKIDGAHGPIVYSIKAIADLLVSEPDAWYSGE